MNETQKPIGWFEKERMEKALSEEKTLIPHGLTPEEIIKFILKTNQPK